MVLPELHLHIVSQSDLSEERHMGIIHDLIAVAHARLTQLAFIEGLSALHALPDKPACCYTVCNTSQTYLLTHYTLHAMLTNLCVGSASERAPAGSTVSPALHSSRLRLRSCCRAVGVAQDRRPNS